MSVDLQNSVESPSIHTARRLRVASLVGLLLSAVATVFAVFSGGGSLLVVEPHRLLSFVTPGQEVALFFEFHNSTNREITVIGADDRCDETRGCSKTTGLPTSVLPGSSRSIRVMFTARAESFDYPISFYTSDLEYPELRVRIMSREG